MDPFVILTFIVVGLLQILIPIGLGYWARKKFDVKWKVFAYGALFFILVQVVHIPLVLVTQTPIALYLTQLAIGQMVILIILAIYLGLLAGLFEELGRFFVFKRFFRRKKIKLNKENALMFGLGWGGLESIFIAMIMFLTMFSYTVATSLTEQDLLDLKEQYGDILTQEQLDAIKAQSEAFVNLTPLDLLPSLFERIMALVLQIAFTLLVFTSVLNSRKLLLYLAIAWHAAVDFTAVILISLTDVFIAELGILMFALIAFFYIERVFKK